MLLGSLLHPVEPTQVPRVLAKPSKCRLSAWWAGVGMLGAGWLLGSASAASGPLGALPDAPAERPASSRATEAPRGPGGRADADGDQPAEWALQVSPGDTLTAIAQRLLREPYSWQALQRHNTLRDPHRINPGSTLRIPLAWLRAEPTQALVLQVQGAVAYLPHSAGPALPDVPAVGQRLEVGTRLRTGDHASLTLQFEDGSQVQVTPGTQLRLQQMQRFPGTGATQTQLQLDTGAVESRVAPQRAQRSYQIRTPVVTLGVRGTHFRAAVDAPLSAAPAATGVGDQRLEVLSGAVQARATGVAEAAAGQGLVVGPRGEVGPVQTLLPAPQLPALAGPLPAGTRLQWPDLPGAAAYRVQVFASGPAPAALLRDQRSNTASATWPDLTPGTYRLRVRAIAADGLEGQDAEQPLALLAAPAPPGPPPPALALPVDGQRAAGAGIVLSWYRADSGRRHRLQVATDAGFAEPVLDRAVGPADVNLQQLYAALPPGRYHWRVATLDDDGRPGPFSSARTFELRTGAP